MKDSFRAIIDNSSNKNIHQNIFELVKEDTQKIFYEKIIKMSKKFLFKKLLYKTRFKELKNMCTNFEKIIKYRALLKYRNRVK